MYYYNIFLFFYLFETFSAVIAQTTAHRKITVLWLRLPKSLPVLPVVILLYQPSTNTLPMAVYLQRKKISVELKKEGNRQCPLKGIGCFPSIMNDINYFLDSSVFFSSTGFFFSSTTFFLSAFSVFDSVATA